MKTTKQIFSILFIGFFLFSVGCSKDEKNNTNTNPNTGLTVYTNQTGDPNANALQAHYIDEQNGGIMDIYGTFNADGTPKQISNIRYKRANNDSIVNLTIDEQTGKPALAVMEVNGQKLNIITEFTYTANENELIISFYEHDWSNGSSDLLYSAKYLKDGTEVSESPIYVAGNKSMASSTTVDDNWLTLSIVSGIAIAETVAAVGGGFSLLGTAAATVTAAVAAVGAGTLIVAGITVATLASIINDAGASEISPEDIPYPEGTEPINPFGEESIPVLPDNPCTNSTLTLDLGLDPGNKIVGIATGGNNGPYTFYWSTGESSTANTYTSIVVEEEGLYSALVVDGNGCAANASIEVGELTGCDGLTEFTDPRDGQTYAVVQIGNQCWFAENLNYDTGNSWCYDDDDSNCSTYGRLYDWQTALSACPDGWHLPSDAEWAQLIDNLGGGDVAGGKMKSTTGWNDPNTDATNSSGFSGLPGGLKKDDGGSQGNDTYDGIGYYVYWWSSTEAEDDASFALYRILGYAYGNAGLNDAPKTVGLSCRCVRD